MRFEGKLGQWSEARSSGFIISRDSGAEIYVHASAFPPDGRRPHVGEPLSFEIGQDLQGNKRAINVLRPIRQEAAPPRPPIRHKVPHHVGRNPLPGLIRLLLFAALALYGYTRFAPEFSSLLASAMDRPPASSAMPTRSAAPDSRSAAPATRLEPAATPGFRCDGRTRCSEMKSCAEATFFLRNCPGVEMDGDGDGIPCERQWCG